MKQGMNLEQCQANIVDFEGGREVCVRLMSLKAMALVGFSAVSILAGCQKEITREVRLVPQPSSTPASVQTHNQVDGASNGGGGGFVSDNSKILLTKASGQIAAMLRYSTPEIFAQLPKEWGREKLADIIENIRLSPHKENQRDGKELMFDYGSDAKGPYIEALKPFFHVYGAVPVKFEKADILRSITMDLEVKLLHEVGHHIGLNETNAEKFAIDVFQALDQDLLLCRFSAIGDTEIPVLIQRSTGDHLGSFSASAPNPLRYDWLKSKLGKPTLPLGYISESFVSQLLFIAPSPGTRFSPNKQDHTSDSMVLIDRPSLPYGSYIDGQGAGPVPYQSGQSIPFFPSTHPNSYWSVKVKWNQVGIESATMEFPVLKIVDGVSQPTDERRQVPLSCEAYYKVVSIPK